LWAGVLPRDHVPRILSHRAAYRVGPRKRRDWKRDIDGTMRLFALRPYHPSARRVYQLAAPLRNEQRETAPLCSIAILDEAKKIPGQTPTKPRIILQYHRLSAVRFLVIQTAQPFKAHGPEYLGKQRQMGTSAGSK